MKCNGNVIIEDDVYVGTGSIIKQGKPGRPLVIGKGAKLKLAHMSLSQYRQAKLFWLSCAEDESCKSSFFAK